MMSTVALWVIAISVAWLAFRATLWFNDHPV
jgi:hypothetical protein